MSSPGANFSPASLSSSTGDDRSNTDLEPIPTALYPEFMDTLITVFGGTGFLGRRIVQVLARRGYRVRIAARHPEKLHFGTLETRLQRQAMDVRDERAVAQALEGAEAAVNAVSLYTEKRGSDGFREIHVKAAVALAQAANERHLKLVHLSGIGVNRNSPSTYVQARALGDIEVRETDPGAVVLRPSALFGDGDGLLGTLERLTRLPVVPLFGRGTVRLQPTHVDDVALAVAESIEKPTLNGVFELGGGDLCHYRQLVEAMARARRRHCYLMPVPMPLWYLLAKVLSLLPEPPLTVHQLALLSHDNVAAPDLPGYPDLALTPRGILQAMRKQEMKGEPR